MSGNQKKKKKVVLSINETTAKSFVLTRAPVAMNRTTLTRDISAAILVLHCVPVDAQLLGVSLARQSVAKSCLL